ncbi:OmpA family protein [Patulibacter minatonensis]|uniref:OmpA family protein n=1 Tax=Patulibacter minatonensis TaxID=298163 RepID=UPI0004BA63C8|nr:OmpA family protein [Patulibacter minatonensis]
MTVVGSTPAGVLRGVAVGVLGVAVLLAGGGAAQAEPTADELAASVVPLSAPIELLRPGSTVRPVAPRPRRGRTAVPADVLFDFGRASVRPVGRRALVRLARSVATGTGVLRVVGHTDGVGDDAVNRALSRRRARAVAAVLRPGLPGVVRIVATGRGEDDPVADETTPDGEDDPDGRARNRRVELRVVRR